MNGNIFLRTAVVFLVMGMTWGMYMGMNHDFAPRSAHAHLNLVGGFLMFMSGMFYRVHPHLSKKAMTAHYILATVGVLVFVPGIAGSAAGAAWAVPVTAIGGAMVYLSMLFFAVMVYLGTRAKKD